MNKLTWPDTRGWALLGLFVSTWLVLGLLAFRPALSDNTLFVSLATLIVGSGGLLAALGYYYGSSKSSTAKDDTIASMTTKIPPSP